MKKPERPTIKSGLKLRSEKSVDFRPIQYSVIYDFHASKVNLGSQINFSTIFFQYGGSCLSVAEGEIVTADENGTDEDGWIAVRKNDKRGKVPKSVKSRQRPKSFQNIHLMTLIIWQECCGVLLGGGGGCSSMTSCVPY